ncbi:MAG: type II toxin-antitoxin system VapC family toxin [Gammaproteobacteria bacterium]|nr:type II toxin-antitoxin system VapC family toxin [Gammaproteobacteria bacterium]
MIAAVDTSALLDVFLPDERYGRESQERLRAAYDAGAVVVSDVVYAELTAAFPDRATLDRALREINATTSPINTNIAFEAGVRWKRYREAGGPRTRIITDFLIGAHALAVADTLLTRDRGFFGTYFPELRSAH